MKPKRFYLDTSVYLCILLGEEGASKLIRQTSGQELMSSSLMILEANRNLVRLARLGMITPSQLSECLKQVSEDQTQLVLRDLTLDLCQSLELPLVSVPRSLDLAHLRTALWFHRREPLDGFLTLDEKQKQAAGEMGLPI